MIKINGTQIMQIERIYITNYLLFRNEFLLQDC